MGESCCSDADAVHVLWERCELRFLNTSAAFRAVTSENFRGEEVTFGNYYDVMDVQSTMICDVFAMISSVATVVLQKPLDSQKNSLDLKNITRFKISALKLTVSPETISSCSSSSENLKFASLLKSIMLKRGKSYVGKLQVSFKSLKRQQWGSVLL